MSPLHKSDYLYCITKTLYIFRVDLVLAKELNVPTSRRNISSITFLLEIYFEMKLLKIQSKENRSAI